MAAGERPEVPSWSSRINMKVDIVSLCFILGIGTWLCPPKRSNVLGRLIMLRENRLRELGALSYTQYEWLGRDPRAAALSRIRHGWRWNEHSCEKQLSIGR